MKTISNQTTGRPKNPLKIRRYGGNRHKIAALPNCLSVDQVFHPLRQVAVVLEENEIASAWQRMEARLTATNHKTVSD